MDFDLYRNAAARLLVVPSALARPHGLSNEGVLHRVGSVSFEFRDASRALAQAIALRGYGVADEADEVMISKAMGLTPPSLPPPLP